MDASNSETIVGCCVLPSVQRLASRAVITATDGASEALYFHGAFHETLCRLFGDIMVGGCEEVTAEQLRNTARQACQAAKQMKAFLRCGMGPWQGRWCGLTASGLMGVVAGAADQGCGGRLAK